MIDLHKEYVDFKKSKRFSKGAWFEFSHLQNACSLVFHIWPSVIDPEGKFYRNPTSRQS